MKQIDKIREKDVIAEEEKVNCFFLRDLNISALDRNSAPVWNSLA